MTTSQLHRRAPGVEAGKLDSWAAEVLREAQRLAELGTEWVPACPADWNTARAAYGPLVKPMAQAIGAAGGAVHEQAAIALRVLRLPGKADQRGRGARPLKMALGSSTLTYLSRRLLLAMLAVRVVAKGEEGPAAAACVRV